MDHSDSPGLASLALVRKILVALWGRGVVMQAPGAGPRREEGVAKSPLPLMQAATCSAAGRRREFFFGARISVSAVVGWVSCALCSRIPGIDAVVLDIKRRREWGQGQGSTQNDSRRAFASTAHRPQLIDQTDRTTDNRPEPKTAL